LIFPLYRKSHCSSAFVFWVVRAFVFRVDVFAFDRYASSQAEKPFERHEPDRRHPGPYHRDGSIGDRCVIFDSEKPDTSKLSLTADSSNATTTFFLRSKDAKPIYGAFCSSVYYTLCMRIRMRGK
jgi:hypothetical protein